LLLAYLIMICGGIFLSYGVFNISIGYQPWTNRISTIGLSFIAACFHITLIVGAIATSFLYTKIDIVKLHVSKITHRKTESAR
jgi:hypothetical protein